MKNLQLFQKTRSLDIEIKNNNISQIFVQCFTKRETHRINKCKHSKILIQKRYI